jgi:hypothetical protein
MVNILNANNATLVLENFELNSLFQLAIHSGKGTGGSRRPKSKQSITKGVFTLVGLPIEFSFCLLSRSFLLLTNSLVLI